MPTKEELTLALTKADAAATAGDASAAADARKLAQMIRALDAAPVTPAAPAAKAPPASMAPAAKAPPAPMPVGAGLMASAGGTRVMLNAGGDPLAPVDPVSQAMVAQKRDRDIEARRAQQVADAHAQYQARESQAATEKFNANYRDSLSPIDRMRYDVSNTVRSGAAAVENATIGQIPGSEQAADFIHEQVVPRAKAVGEMVDGGRFVGVPQMVTGGLTEWGATTARDPQQGLTEAEMALNPTRFASEGYNQLVDASGDLIDGIQPDTGQKALQGAGNLAIGTLGMVPGGSFTVDAMRAPAQAERAAMAAQRGRVLANDAMPPAVPPTRPAPPPVQPPAPQAAKQSMFSSTGQYSVSTQDSGAFDVQFNRTPDGGAVIMHDKGTIPIAPEFAKGKSDEELLAYYFEPLGFQGATKGGASQPPPVQPAAAAQAAPPVPPQPPAGGPPVAAGAVSPPPAVQPPPVAPAISREQARAADLLIRKLEADGLTMEDVRKIRDSLARRGDSGVYETIGELAALSGKSSGANLRGLQMAGGAAPGELQNALVSVVTENAKKMPDRLSRSAARATGQKAENAVATLDELDTRLKAEATPAYDDAYAAPVDPKVFQNEILPVLNTPSGQEAIAAARNNLAMKAAELQGRAAREGTERWKMEWARAQAAVKSIDDYMADPVRGSAIPTTMALDYTKRAFDDVIEKAGHTSDTARIVRGTKNNFADSVSWATGGKYGRALGLYEDIKRLENAFDDGLEALNKKTWQLERDLTKGRGGAPYSGGEIEALAMGVARSIEDLIEAGDQAALTKLLKGKALKNMATALGSEKAAKQFEQSIRRLAANREWGRRVAGGSDTAMRQAAIKDAGAETDDAVTRVLDRVESAGSTISLPGLVNDVAIKPIARAGKKIYQQMRYPGVYDEGVNKALVPLIATPMTPKNLDEVIRIVEARMAQKGRKRAAPTVPGQAGKRRASKEGGFSSIGPLGALTGGAAGYGLAPDWTGDGAVGIDDRFINALFGTGAGYALTRKLGNKLPGGPAPKAPPRAPVAGGSPAALQNAEKILADYRIAGQLSEEQLKPLAEAINAEVKRLQAKTLPHPLHDRARIRYDATDEGYAEVMRLNGLLMNAFRTADGSIDIPKAMRWVEKNDPDRVLRIEAGRTANDIEDGIPPEDPDLPGPTSPPSMVKPRAPVAEGSIDGATQKLASVFDQDGTFDDMLDAMAKDKSIDKSGWMEIYKRLFGSTEGVAGNRADVIDTLRRERIINVRNRKARVVISGRKFEPYALPPIAEGSYGAKPAQFTAKNGDTYEVTFEEFSEGAEGAEVSFRPIDGKSVGAGSNYQPTGGSSLGEALDVFRGVEGEILRDIQKSRRPLYVLMGATDRQNALYRKIAATKPAPDGYRWTEYRGSVALTRDSVQPPPRAPVAAPKAPPASSSTVKPARQVRDIVGDAAPNERLAIHTNPSNGEMARLSVLEPHERPTYMDARNVELRYIEDADGNRHVWRADKAVHQHVSDNLNLEGRTGIIEIRDGKPYFQPDKAAGYIAPSTVKPPAPKPPAPKPPPVQNGFGGSKLPMDEGARTRSLLQTLARPNEPQRVADLLAGTPVSVTRDEAKEMLDIVRMHLRPEDPYEYGKGFGFTLDELKADPSIAEHYLDYNPTKIAQFQAVLGTIGNPAESGSSKLLAGMGEGSGTSLADNLKQDLSILAATSVIGSAGNPDDPTAGLPVAAALIGGKYGSRAVRRMAGKAPPVGNKLPPASMGFGGGKGPKPPGKSGIPGEIARRATVGVATGAAVNFANDAGAQDDLAPKIRQTEQDIADLKKRLADFDKITDPRAKQQLLKDAGYYAGRIDGNIAGATTEGIEKWKAAQRADIAKAESDLTDLVRRDAYQRNHPDPVADAIREYGPTVAFVGALFGMKVMRGGAAKKAARVAEAESKNLNRLITKGPVTSMVNKADQSRPENLNELWQKGGAKTDELPFKQDSSGKWKANPNAKPAQELFKYDGLWQSVSKYIKGKDLALILGGSLDASGMQILLDKANKDLAEAELEWKNNPSDETFKRVEDAKGAVMAYTTLRNLGAGLAGGRVLGSIGAKYAKPRPNIPAAATEQAALKRYIAGKKPPPKPRAPKAPPQLPLPSGGGIGGGGKP